MVKKSSTTKTEILEAARTEFFAHGYEGARLQKIADQIGVTKAMIHYYFNTKKELFEHVYKQSIAEIFGDLPEIVEKDIPLFKKIEQLIESCLQKSATHPLILVFIVTESQRKPDWLKPIFEDQIDIHLESFNTELEEAASEYRIASVDARQLLLNIFSLCYYPTLSSNINDVLINTNGQDLVVSRKGIVLDTVLNWLTA
jgi:AcrR family transcriptional regulator